MTAIRPSRLEVRDLPRDTTRSLGNLNKELCYAFNYCRQYPAKLDQLETTIKTVALKIKAYKADLKRQEAAQAKTAVEAPESAAE